MTFTRTIKILQCDKKLTMMTGKVFWLEGVFSENYQVDRKNMNPILYSFKFFDKKLKQVLYTGRNENGWVVS